MDKSLFIATYVTNFLSSYMANEYADQCSRGWPLMRPSDNVTTQPIDDAYSLAEDAWIQIVEHGSWPYTIK